jgi:phosphatidylglycerophosphatase C
MKPLDLYDFDKTIYGGDSTVDFYWYCLKRNPRLLRHLPGQAWHTVLFLLKLEDTTVFKGHFFTFLRSLGDTERVVEDFWATHYAKMRAWYLNRDHSHDVIISSSPEFLLAGPVRRLGAQALIATVIDPRTGAISGKNCRGPEKVRRFQEQFGAAPVARAYSDHVSDLPLLGLAAEAYLVKGETVSPI